MKCLKVNYPIFGILFLCFSITGFAQTPVNQKDDASQFMRMKKAEDDGKGKNTTPVNTNEPNNTNRTGTTLTPPPIEQPNYEEMSIRSEKPVVDEANANDQGTPVTYVGDEKNITSVDYAIDSQQSNFDNLTNMIDVRDKVHASNNYATLTQTANYNKLLADITTYRAKFNADVNKKGFENCSKREQSLFLSFLKEEGKKEEYTMYMNKLKP